LSGSETIHSAKFTAFFKNIADMADLLKQMWFLLTIEMYKLWHKGMMSRKEAIHNFNEDINKQAKTNKSITISSALLKSEL
jgi:hypothetical protein